MLKANSMIFVLSWILLLAGSPPMLAQTPSTVETTDATPDAKPAAKLEKWFGTLDVKVTQLRLLVDVSTNEEGQQQAVLTSLDQGNSEIACDSFSLDGGEMKFAIESLKASFTGNVAEDRTQVVGKFTQMGVTHDLTLARVTSVPKRQLIEAWIGDLQAGGQKLRLQFRQLKEAGEEIILFDSLTQHAEGMTAQMSREGDEISFKVPAVRGRFVGTLSDDGQTLEGEWSQMGAAYPLQLIKAETEEEALPRSRPQTPQPPFSYDTEDVSFKNEQQGHTLAGTLTLPKTNAPFPCVIMVSGSGPQDRDETIFGHKPFAVIADHLTKQGIATLRYDDRGIGQSKGDFASATTADFALDAEAAIDFLKSDSRMNPKRIGLVGHSEGGLIATMVAARRPDLAHIILLAGPGVPGDQILTDQSAAMSRAMGMSEDKIQLQAALMDELVEAAKTGLTPEQITIILDKHAELLDDNALDADESDLLALQMQQLGTPWFKFFLNYDPRPDLGKIACPVLALVGEKDLQVTVELNLPEIEAALKRGGNADYRCERLPGLNHLFQPCQTGSMSEYDTIERTLDESLLTKITEWVTSH